MFERLKGVPVCGFCFLCRILSISNFILPVHEIQNWQRASSSRCNATLYLENHSVWLPVQREQIRSCSRVPYIQVFRFVKFCNQFQRNCKLVWGFFMLMHFHKPKILHFFVESAINPNKKGLGFDTMPLMMIVEQGPSRH